MTLKELKAALSKAQAPSWYKNLTLNLNFNTIGISHNLEGFTAIYLFFEAQKKGWEALGDKMPTVLNESSSFFKNTLNNLEQFISYAQSYTDNQLSGVWSNVHRNINSKQPQKIFTYNCPETEFLIKLDQEQPEHTQEVFNFITAYKTGHGISPSTPKNFASYAIAYEFIQKDTSKITERRNAEKASITRLRNDFSKYLTESELQLNDFIKASQEKSENYAKAIDTTKESKETVFNDWFNEAKENHKSFVKETGDNKDALEKTYKELLSLKAPADYWANRATTLKKQGQKILVVLVALVVLGAGLLFTLLLLLPGETLDKLFQTTGTAIRWSIIFITFISFLAYGIGLLAKVTFSAFHLARDAEERKQLTYLYLSLKHDGNVDDKDRQLILQSLFSRADTGLLKDDASPTMPGANGFINKFISQ